LSLRIREAEKDVQRLVHEELSDDQQRPSGRKSSDVDLERQQQKHDIYAHDGGSDDDLSDGAGEDSDESYDALEARFHGLEEEVAILVADVHDLALYTKLNVTGFMKILKVGSFHSYLTPTTDLHLNQKHDVKFSCLIVFASLMHLARNKLSFSLNLRSYNNTSRSALSTNTTGTPSSSNFPNSTTLFVLVVILFKAIPVLEAIKVPSSVKPPSTGSIQITLSPLSWPFYGISLYWVVLLVENALPTLRLTLLVFNPDKDFETKDSGMLISFDYMYTTHVLSNHINLFRQRGS
jgi:hypothetical protein